MTSEDSVSESIARQLGAPVVRGILKDISGMTLSYFCEENIGVPCTSMVFESGQHDAPESIDSAMAAVINCAAAAGMVLPDDMQSKANGKLTQKREQLPQIVELIHTHYTQENDGFCLIPGFDNFHPVRRDELLGRDNQGDIRSPYDGMMLMPRYLQAGIEGFFLVRQVQ